jgi:hypothetical protein
VDKKIKSIKNMIEKQKYITIKRVQVDPSID